MLMMLDELETHPTAYKRREIDISTNDGSLMVIDHLFSSPL